MMVSRLALSLKKSADPRSVAEWRLGHFTRLDPVDNDVGKMRFAMRSMKRPSIGTGSSETMF